MREEDRDLLISANCKQCGVKHSAYFTTSGEVKLIGEKETCRCGGDEFVTWEDKIQPPPSDDS